MQSNINSRKSIIIGIFFVIMAGVMFFSGYHVLKQAEVPSYYIRTTGKDLQNNSYLESSRGGEITEYYPVVQFAASNGDTYTVNGNISSPNAPTYSPGQNVPIAYNATNPGLNTKMINNGNAKVSGYLLMGFSVFMLVMGFIVGHIGVRHQINPINY